MPLGDDVAALLKKEPEVTSCIESTYLQSLLNENISSGKCIIKLLKNAEPTDAKGIVRIAGDDIN